MTKRKRISLDEYFAGEESRAEPQAEDREEPGEEVGADEVSGLRFEVESLKEQLAREHDLYLRALADFNNYKKRHEGASARHIQTANQELILKLLPVVDNFERALSAAMETESFDALAEGVDLTLRQLQSLLAAEGVSPISTVGEQFDPALHEAVLSVTTDDVPDHSILEELEKGYMHKDKVIRPAKVKVAVNS